MNLIIGNTSQLAYFFPDDYIKISSRNVDLNYLKSNKWNSVYITFAEQRVHLNDVDYITPNYNYTLDIILNLIDCSDKIVIYTTCELWNEHKGMIDINTKILNTYPNDYTLSKEMLINKIYELRKIDVKYNKVVIIHPFHFNSTYRRPGFLFGSIFDSIINKKQIEIGNTYFYRDMVHTKYMVERSINAVSDEMVGSGRLFFVNDFIRDLYKSFDMDFEYFVKENKNTKNNHSEKLYYSYQDIVYSYQNLLNDTINDIKNKIEK